LIEVTSREEIYNVSDGIYGWLAADLPVVGGIYP
jgi:rhodanese-related sulfurtransferase